MTGSASAPHLSVVIVAYRSAAEIRGCLGSWPESLRGGAIERIVVVNPPDDGTGGVVRAEFPGVQVIEPAENLGFGRANNLGYRACSGRHVLFLNPDTEPRAGTLEHLLALLEREPGIGMVSPRLVTGDGSLDLACKRRIPGVWDGFCRASGLAARYPRSRWFAGYNLGWLDDRGVHEVGAINGAFMLAPRPWLERVGGSGGEVFDEQFFMYGDDLDLCWRVTRAGGRIVYDGRVEWVHLKGRSVGREAAEMSRAIFDGNLAFYLKHFAPPGRPWMRWKWEVTFALWRTWALWRARRRGHTAVRPL